MRKVRKVNNPGSIIQAVFGDSASVIKASEAGFDLKPIGALNAAVRVSEAATIMVYNAGGATAYVTFGPQTVAAPTGPTDGIPILAGEKFMVSSGDQAWIRSNTATVYGYLADNSAE